MILDAGFLCLPVTILHASTIRITVTYVSTTKTQRHKGGATRIILSPQGRLLDLSVSVSLWLITFVTVWRMPVHAEWLQKLLSLYRSSWFGLPVQDDRNGRGGFFGDGHQEPLAVGRDAVLLTERVGQSATHMCGEQRNGCIGIYGLGV